jgi:hypothetical protein
MYHQFMTVVDVCPHRHTRVRERGFFIRMIPNAARAHNTTKPSANEKPFIDD